MSKSNYLKRYEENFKENRKEYISEVKSFLKEGYIANVRTFRDFCISKYIAM